ncbi:MAG: DoxX family protein, partial [Actinomycetes bacterium]
VVATTGIAKLPPVPAMSRQAVHLGYTAAVFRRLGFLELAAAAGLLGGLVWPPVGVAAAIGLVLLLALAARAHLRAGDPFVRALPPGVLAVLAGLVTVAGCMP